MHLRKIPVKPLSRALVIIAFCAFSIIYAAKTAHAGLISFLSSMITGNPASAQIQAAPNSQNSQTITVLQAAINTDPNPNKVSDTVPIDGNSLVADTALSNASQSDESSAQISVYTVRDGDTLSSIAKMFNVSVNTLVWANNLGGSRSTLSVGQNLIILPVSGIKYTIAKGDTISGIANKYKADINEVLKYNDITIASPLSVGDVIIIPDAELAAPAAPSSLHSTPTSNLPAYSGYYIRPIVGGYRSQGLHGHNAVDLAAPVGTPIHAAANGIVIISIENSYWNGAYGNYVVISHPNGTQTLYAHTLKNAVVPGQYVKQGQTIAYIGLTGKTTGAHVHFEIRGARNPF